MSEMLIQHLVYMAAGYGLGLISSLIIIVCTRVASRRRTRFSAADARFARDLERWIADIEAGK